MLVLSCEVGVPDQDTIVIAGNITVQVLSAKGKRVRLGVVASKEVPVDRAKVHKRRENGKSSGDAA